MTKIKKRDKPSSNALQALRAKLKIERESLDKAKAHIEDLERQIEEMSLAEVRETWCVKIVCPDCWGGGRVCGPDTVPPSPDQSCARCGGGGFLWAVKFEGRNKGYEDLMDASEI